MRSGRWEPCWASEYAAELRADAVRRRALWPDDPIASALAAVADEIERRARDHEMETLTLERASEESGFSYGHLQRLVSSGELQNVGRPGVPRVRRGDIPRKASRLPTINGDIAEEALARRAPDPDHCPKAASDPRAGLLGPRALSFEV